MRRSIEVEYWVIDDDGRLVEPGELVDASPGAEREFVEPLLEIKTTPCTSTDELRDELFTRINAVVQRADELGLGLVPLATPMTEEPIERLPSERTGIQERAVGEPFEHVCCCAGTHIHIEQRPSREIDQLNVLTALDPALALVNSSPYARQTPDVPGARSRLYRSAYDEIEYQGELWPYHSDTHEWRQRLEAAYDAFCRAAVNNGIEETAVESVFEPENAVWVPIKLRDTFSTVEWRSPDTALPSQVIKLADDLVSIVEQLVDAEVRIDGEVGLRTDDTIVLPEFETIESHVDAAISEGLESDALRAYLDRMGFDISAYEPITREFDLGSDLTTSETRQIRLQYARKLESDVQRAPTTVTDGSTPTGKN